MPVDAPSAVRNNSRKSGGTTRSMPERPSEKRVAETNDREALQPILEWIERAVS